MGCGWRCAGRLTFDEGNIFLGRSRVHGPQSPINLQSFVFRNSSSVAHLTTSRTIRYMLSRSQSSTSRGALRLAEVFLGLRASVSQKEAQQSAPGSLCPALSSDEWKPTTIPSISLQPISSLGIRVKLTSMGHNVVPFQAKPLEMSCSIFLGQTRQRVPLHPFGGLS